LQKAKFTVSAPSTNGIAKPAPKLRFCSAKTPTATSGIASEKLERTPAGVMSSAGGSLKPSSGISSRRRSTNDSGPANTMSPICTSTSGLRPVEAANSTLSKPIFRNVGAPRRWMRKSVSVARTSDFGVAERPSNVASISIFVVGLTTKIGSFCG
jgi:hypothetical protein